MSAISDRSIEAPHWNSGIRELGTVAIVPAFSPSPGAGYLKIKIKSKSPH